MTFPLTIVDDFFDDPDAIVELANSCMYFDTDVGNWPGKRTEQLYEIDNRFFNYFGEKIFKLYFCLVRKYFNIVTRNNLKNGKKNSTKNCQIWWSYVWSRRDRAS